MYDKGLTSARASADTSAMDTQHDAKVCNSVQSSEKSKRRLLCGVL